MKNKTFALFALSALALMISVAAVSAVTLSTWNLNATGLAAVSSFDADISASSLTAGAGLTNFATATFNADGVTTDTWATTATPGSTNYYQVTLAPVTGSNFVVNTISFNQFSSVAAMNFVVNWSTDGFVTSTQIGSAGTTTTTSAATTLSSLNIPVNDGETLTLRVFGYNTLATTTFSLANLNIQGEVNLPEGVVECFATGDNGNLLLDVDDPSVEEGYGNDNEWFPLDTINVDVNLENDGNEKISNIAVNWGLYNKDTGKFIIDDEEPDFNLKDGDDRDVPLSFKLEDVDKFDGTGDYVFYVWAIGEDAEFDDAETCIVSSQDIEPVIESDFVVLDTVLYTETVQCSEEVTVSADIWNIGDSDQDDVYIFANQKDFGITNQRVEVGSVDAFDNSKLSFSFKVPEGLAEKTYNLVFDVYNEDDDIFQSDFDDDESTFNVPFTVKGNCETSGKASVSATLESGGKAGEDMIVKAKITNTGAKKADYILSAEGFGQWATSGKLDVSNFTLDAGQSKDVTITLQTKADADGEQTLNLVVLSGNQLAVTQPVSVLVEGSSSAGFLSSITGGAISGSNSLWVIGALNVLLVLVILIVAIRFFTK